MKFYRILIISLIVLLTVGLSACERSAASPPVDADGTINYPVVDENATVPPMEQLQNISTQTAIAAAGGTTSEGAVAEGEGAVVAGEEVPAGEEAKPTETPQPAPAEPAAADPAQAEPEEVVLDYDIPNSYTLQHGEFPYCLARRFDVAPSALLSANGLSTSSVTYPGMVLTIPKNAGAFNQGARALRQHPTSYTVSAGDTVNSIACLFGDVDPRAIVAKNGLTDSYTLNVGQTIQIP